MASEEILGLAKNSAVAPTGNVKHLFCFIAIIGLISLPNASYDTSKSAPVNTKSFLFRGFVTSSLLYIAIQTRLYLYL